MNELLYVKKDFLDTQFELSLVVDFNLYQDELVVVMTTLFNAITLSSPTLHHIKPNEVESVYIKRNFIGATCRIYVQLKFNESLGGSLLSSNKICLARNMSIENAERLQKILLDFKNGILIVGVRHAPSESIENYFSKKDRQVGYRMDMLLPKFLKIVLLVFTPVLIMLLIYIFVLLYRYL